MQTTRNSPQNFSLSLVFALILAGLLFVPSAARAGFFDDFRADAFTSVSTMTDSVTGGLASFFTNLKDALKRESEKTSPNNPQTSPKEEPKKQNEKQKQGTPALVSPAPSDLEAKLPSKLPSQPTITPTPFRGRSPDQRVGVERTVERVVRVPVLPPPTPVPASSILDTVNDKLSQLENKLKAEIYRVASNASSQNSATYQVVALSNRINQLANLAISGATITGSTFAGEISATTGGFSGTFSVGGATTLSSTLSAGTTTLTNLAVTNTSTSTFAGPVAHATGDLIIGRGGSGNLLLNPYGGNLGVGTTSPYSMLSVAGQIVGQNYVATSTTATSTFAGRLLASFAPTLAHTFSSWASGASGANPLGAALIINPASATADSNLFAAAVNGSVRFLIDAEGDVFSNSLTTTGIVTLSTTTASTFSVENNTTLGDSITDTTTVNGTLTVTGTTTASTVAGNFGIGTTSPYAKLSVQAGSGDTNQTLFVIASSTSSATTTHFVITNTGFVGIGTTSPGTTLAVAGAGLFNSTLTAFSTITAPSFTATSTTAVSSFQQLLANASTTLQNFTFLNATGTQATTTSFFSTTASSTNLYATSLAVGGATLGNTTIGGTLSVSGLSSLSGGASTTLASIFNTLYIGNTATSTLQGSTTGTSTLQGFLNVAGTNSTSTFSGNLAVNNQATTTSLVVSNNASLGTLAVGGATTLSSTLNVTGLATLANLLSTGSTTLQNFTAVNSTTTNATTTSFFSTTASSTNLYATSLAVGGATLGNTTVGGTLSVSGLSSLSGGASTTLFSSLGPAYFGSTATSSFSTAGALTLASALAVGSGGTGATTLTGLLQGNGTSAITAVTGTAGQFPYFNGASTLAATSTIFLSTGQLVGLGTSTPYSKLSVWGGGTGTGQLFELTNSASTTIAKFLDNGTAYILGNLGIGTTSPYRKLSITDTVSTAQAVIAYDSTRYTELQTNSVGDFIITTQGNDAFLNNDNLWVCTGGACPAGSPTGQGNLIVENRLGVGTSSPYAALSVVGETVSSYFTATSTTATSTFAGAFTITGPTTVQNRLNVANTVGGTVDAITATFLPAFTALTDKTKVTVRATGANTLTTPSFAPDGLTAKTIVKENLVALVAGDIAGAGHEIDLIYNSTADKWVLLNPKATVPLSSKVISFSRDTGLASGNQSITGAGFTPTSAIFVGGVNSTAGRATIGFADSAKSGLGLSPYGDNATIWEIRSNAILTHSGGANYYTGNVFSWDSDGITIAWTRFGSPTGILYVQAILFK